MHELRQIIETMKKMVRALLLPLYRLLSKLLNRIGYEISPREEADRQKRVRQVLPYLQLVGLPPAYTNISRSQHGQDLLVIALTSAEQHQGFFVEFGAVDGLQNSNTVFLEKTLGWRGIVSEPARRWHEKLRANRSCHVDTRCVFSESGHNLEFGETGSWMGGNTLVQYRDEGGAERKFSATYAVETISLNDLLKEAGAPSVIDFLSVDTEGSEYEILRNVDYDRWSFGLILVEHNFDEEKRDKIRSILNSRGYTKLPVPEDAAGVDDWYASRQIAQKFDLLTGGAFNPA